jgi:hypothetical protein
LTDYQPHATGCGDSTLCFQQQGQEIGGIILPVAIQGPQPVSAGGQGASDQGGALAAIPSMASVAQSGISSHQLLEFFEADIPTPVVDEEDLEGDQPIQLGDHLGEHLGDVFSLVVNRDQYRK